MGFFLADNLAATYCERPGGLPGGLHNTRHGQQQMVSMTVPVPRQSVRRALHRIDGGPAVSDFRRSLTPQSSIGRRDCLTAMTPPSNASRSW